MFCNLTEGSDREGASEQISTKMVEAGYFGVLMPRYFFQIDDGTLLPDETGTELSSLDEARSEAVSLAGQMLRDLDGHFWDQGRKWTLHVTNERSELLFSLHFNSEMPSGKVTYLVEANEDAAGSL